MKQKIKNFLFKKRIKILKSNKGFSLLEVLIGVAIIGIISAIAVPQFAEYRETAAVTSVNTTGDNIAKAFNLCTATKSSCSTLTELKIRCDICGTPDASDGICVPMEQKVQNKTFKACVHVKTDGTVTKTYGGDLKICYVTSAKGEDNVASNTDDSDPYVPGEAKYIQSCDELNDCAGLDGKGVSGNTFTKNKCEARTAGAVCSSGACT